ncbi:MAG TPA: hypothetical protein V6D08_17500 [Candidatus Obscuribacterales bacterium]
MHFGNAKLALDCDAVSNFDATATWKIADGIEYYQGTLRTIFISSDSAKETRDFCRFLLEITGLPIG